jgi:hypothetical protein
LHARPNCVTIIRSILRPKVFLMTHLRYLQALRSLPSAGGVAVCARMGWDLRRVSDGKRIDDASAGIFTIFS